MADNQQRNPMTKLSGMWKGKTGAGDNMIAGSNGGVRYVILPNKKKQPGDKQPDCFLFITQDEPRDGNRRDNG